jgi:hypothetical protein
MHVTSKATLMQAELDYLILDPKMKVICLGCSSNYASVSVANERNSPNYQTNITSRGSLD